MRKKTRLISLIMLFVLGAITLRALVADSSAHQDCSEFGHTHFYRTHVIARNMIKSMPSETRDKGDQNCHAGQSIGSLFFFTGIEIVFKSENFKISFDHIFNVQSNFKSPVIEPSRRPPKQT